MAYERSTFDYWNGSAWVNAQTVENQNALISFDIQENLSSPVGCIAVLSNRAGNPYDSTTANRKGPLTDVLTDFIIVRVIDTGSKSVLFYGRVYHTKEVYDRQFGNVLDV